MKKNYNFYKFSRQAEENYAHTKLLVRVNLAKKLAVFNR